MKFLTNRGYSAEHVMDIGLRDADDDPIWNYAIKTEAFIVTKDEDFLVAFGSACAYD